MCVCVCVCARGWPCVNLAIKSGHSEFDQQTWNTHNLSLQQKTWSAAQNMRKEGLRDTHTSSARTLLSALHTQHMTSEKCMHFILGGIMFEPSHAVYIGHSQGFTQSSWTKWVLNGIVGTHCPSIMFKYNFVSVKENNHHPYCCLCVCVCVWVRERERESERVCSLYCEQRAPGSVCVCVCVCFCDKWGHKFV